MFQQTLRVEGKDAQLVQEWYNRFKDDHTCVESETRSGRPETFQNEVVID